MAQKKCSKFDDILPLDFNGDDAPVACGGGESQTNLVHNCSQATPAVEQINRTAGKIRYLLSGGITFCIESALANPDTSGPESWA
jgi:hypothetical protein